MTMRTMLIGIMMPTVLLLSGCAHTMSQAELSGVLQERAAIPIDFWWYAGSDDAYHYLKNHLVIGTKTYRVSRDDLSIAAPFPVTRDKSKWLMFHSVSELTDHDQREPQPSPGAYSSKAAGGLTGNAQE